MVALAVLSLVTRPGFLAVTRTVVIFMPVPLATELPPTWATVPSRYPV